MFYSISYGCLIFNFWYYLSLKSWRTSEKSGIPPGRSDLYFSHFAGWDGKFRLPCCIFSCVASNGFWGTFLLLCFSNSKTKGYFINTIEYLVESILQYLPVAQLTCNFYWYEWCPDQHNNVYETLVLKYSVQSSATFPSRMKTV